MPPIFEIRSNATDWGGHVRPNFLRGFCDDGEFLLGKGSGERGGHVWSSTGSLQNGENLLFLFGRPKAERLSA